MITISPISSLSLPFRRFLMVFLCVLSVGFYTGIGFVAQTDATSPRGVEQAYNGNEEDLNAKVLKFKKSKREMLTIIHTHVLSLSFIFVLLGILVWGTQVSVKWKLFLSIEPFVSVILTFGGLFLLWMGYTYFTYLVVFSGILMTLTYTVAAFLVFLELLNRTKKTKTEASKFFKKEINDL